MAQRVGASSYCENSSRTQENVRDTFHEAFTVALLSSMKATYVLPFLILPLLLLPLLFLLSSPSFLSFFNGYLVFLSDLSIDRWFLFIIYLRKKKSDCVLQ